MRNRVLRVRPDDRVGSADQNERRFGSGEKSAGLFKALAEDGTHVVEVGSRLYLLSPIQPEGEDLPFTSGASDSDEVLSVESLSRGLTGEDDDFEPVATSLFNLITSSQLRIARRLGRSTGIDVDEESGRLFGLRLGELSRRAAEKIILHLEAHVRSKPEVMRHAC